MQTYSIGLSEGTDLKYAKDVAEHIKSCHYELIYSENEFINSTYKQVQSAIVYKDLSFYFISLREIERKKR